MLIWVLLILGIAIIAGRAFFGNRVGIALLALWIVVALVGWQTGIGVRK